MRSSALVFLIGIVALLFFSQLPPLIWIAPLGIIGGVSLFFWPKKIRFWLRLPVLFILGFSWGLLRADQYLQQSLPADLENKPLVVLGTIVSVPQILADKTTFVFHIEQINAEKNYSFKARLVEHGFPLPLKIGEKWQFTVQLEKPRGFWDDGAFDYQAWLFSQDIRATGYVVNNANYHFYGKSDFYNPIDLIRTHIAEGINHCLQNKPLVGLIVALAVGIRTQITEAQWTVLRATGTNHLFAIAGLHIGFISGIAYCVISFLWRRRKYLPLYLPTTQAAVLGMLFVAVIYSALAGFALPTQRAILMLSLLLLVKLRDKNFQSWQILCLSLWIILIWEPFAILTSSFWLSFGAIALIIYGMSGRILIKNQWWQWGRMQWVLTMGLVPFCLWFFQQASLISFLINIIAIPWIGFLVLPLSLVGGICYLIFPAVGNVLLLSAEYLLELLWWIFNHVAVINGLQWHIYILNPLILICTTIACLLLLAPRGIPIRWLGLFWFLPLLFWIPAGPKAGEVWVTLLDVSEGTAIVVRTQRHVLIYNIGETFGKNLSAVDAVILPFLQTLGIVNIDKLIISDESALDVGGINTLLSQLPVMQIATSVPFRFRPNLAYPCIVGEHWQWEGVNFKFFDFCVLQIKVGTQSILLTGNLLPNDEKTLVAHFAGNLSSQILVAPHHGVANSSTMPLITAIKPEYVLFSVRSDNHYKLPNVKVLQRYQNLGSHIYTTANEGMITFKLDGATAIKTPETYRRDHKKFWDN